MRISGCPALYLYICASRLCRQIFLSSLRFVIQALRDAVFACFCAVQIACCETPAFTPGVSCSMTVCRPMSARLECKHSRAAAAVRIFAQKRRRLLLRFSAKTTASGWSACSPSVTRPFRLQCRMLFLHCRLYWSLCPDLLQGL